MKIWKEKIVISKKKFKKKLKEVEKEACAGMMISNNLDKRIFDFKYEENGRNTYAYFGKEDPMNFNFYSCKNKQFFISQIERNGEIHFEVNFVFEIFNLPIYMPLFNIIVLEDENIDYDEKDEEDDEDAIIVDSVDEIRKTLEAMNLQKLASKI